MFAVAISKLDVELQLLIDLHSYFPGQMTASGSNSCKRLRKHKFNLGVIALWCFRIYPCICLSCGFWLRSGMDSWHWHLNNSWHDKVLWPKSKSLLQRIKKRKQKPLLFGLNDWNYDRITYINLFPARKSFLRIVNCLYWYLCTCERVQCLCMLLFYWMFQVACLCVWFDSSENWSVW